MSAIGKALATYAAAFVVLAILMTLCGSFVLWEWWSPLDTKDARAALAFLPLAPAISVFLVTVESKP